MKYTNGTLIYKVNNKYMDSKKQPMLIINDDKSFTLTLRPTVLHESTLKSDLFVELPNKSKDDYNGLWLGDGGLYNLLNNDFTTTKLEEGIIQTKTEKISYTTYTLDWEVNIEEQLNQSKTDGFSLHHLDVNNTKLDYNSDLLDETYMNNLDIKNEHSPEKETFTDFKKRQTRFRNWFNSNLKNNKKTIESTEINYADKEIEIINWGNVPLSKKGGLFKYFNGKLPDNISKPQILRGTSFNELFMHCRNSSSSENRIKIVGYDGLIVNIIKYNLRDREYKITTIDDKYYEENDLYTYDEFLTLFMSGDIFLSDSSDTDKTLIKEEKLIALAEKITENLGNNNKRKNFKKLYEKKNVRIGIFTENDVKEIFRKNAGEQSNRKQIDHFKNIKNWDTTNVTTMEKAFSRAFNFNSDITEWNTSNVTTMEEMFCFCEKFNQPIQTTGNSWNVSNVKNMSGMFNGALIFNQPIGEWNVTSVDGEYNTTRHENLITKLIISDSEKSQIWENESGKEYMVTVEGKYTTGARKHKRQEHYRKHYPKKTWQEGAKEQHKILEGGMSYMFYGAREFNQDLSKWDVKNVRDMSYMFYNATEFNNGNVSGIGNWFNKEINYKIEDMSYMFAASEGEPTVLEISDNASNISLKRPSYPPTNKFSGDISEWFPLESSNEVNNIRKIFCNCEFFETDISRWYLPAINVKVTKLRGIKGVLENYRSWEDNSRGTYWTYRYRDSVDIGLKEYLTTKKNRPGWFLLSTDLNTGGMKGAGFKENGADEAEWTVLHPHSSLADVYKNTPFYVESVKKIIPRIISDNKTFEDDIDHEEEYFQSISMLVINRDAVDWANRISATPTYDFFNPGFGL